MANHRWESQSVADWESRGGYRMFHGHETFTMDVAPSGAEKHEPLLILHGFPTSSFDFRLSSPRWRSGGGCCCSTWSATASPTNPTPVTPWTAGRLVEAFLADRGASSSHCSATTWATPWAGNCWPGRPTGPGRWRSRRAGLLTNGSIYIEMAQLSPAQEILLSLPDASACPRAPVPTAPPRRPG